ncbi:HlyD family type I secretion periplasmic adaptor subunit [Rhodovulum sp. DZ06]|uniref:HlyD family type I secretion periplasmic adaptor subunit n=1 Tax=Rhodovulum sp. DZ06 TaxID=3425126 RepID=UPI003D33F62D
MSDKSDPRKDGAAMGDALRPHMAEAPKPASAAAGGAPDVTAAVADAQKQVLTRPKPGRTAPPPAAPGAKPPAAAPAPGQAGLPAAGGGGGMVPAPAGAMMAPGGGSGGPGGADERTYAARGPMWLGILSLIILVGGFGVWAAMADLSSAVVAPGKVEVETKQQVVEHPDGGVVGAISVRDGDRVRAGDVLLRLDDTLMVNELESLRGQYWELVARAERLRAEQLGQEELTFSEEILAAEAVSAAVADIVEGQRSLFYARVQTMADQVEQLRERQAQIREQVKGAEAQAAALERQLGLVARELEGQQKLFDQGLAQLTRLLSLQREEARLQGQVGELTAGMAESRGRIAEIEIQILNLRSQRQEESITQLRDIQYQQNQVREQLASLEERMTRLDVRAPIDGVVTGMTVFAVRSVVSPGEPILYIVPSDVELVIESQIDTIFIDQVWAGQPATLRFSAFNSRTTPELQGHVVKVSPDAFQDERTGRTYYTATLAPDEGELEKLEGLTLVPGMPVEGYIQAQSRTPLTYLTKPLTDYFSRAMIEE